MEKYIEKYYSVYNQYFHKKYKSYIIFCSETSIMGMDICLVLKRIYIEIPYKKVLNYIKYYHTEKKYGGAEERLWKI